MATDAVTTAIGTESADTTVIQGATSGGAVDGGTSSGSGWNPDWRGLMMASYCGSCTAQSCVTCSLHRGGAESKGAPTGFVAQPVMLLDTGGISQGEKTSSATPQKAVSGTSAETSLGSTQAAGQSTIVLENQKQGTPESIWMVNDTDASIEGFATSFSLNHGGTESFKINTDATAYRIDIYRLGYYGGDGATLVDSINVNLDQAQVQPDPLFDPTTKLVDAGNWSVSASWAVPTDATSGVYIADLTRLDTGGQNMIPFLVRDDEDPAQITFQTSDTSWEAYNSWGGYNLYGGIDADGRIGRANAVSYNRPFITRDGGFESGPQDFVFGEEYPAIRWLEQNGYDVNYISGVDASRDGSLMLNSQVYMDVGHDEYWSQQQVANVTAARDAGVNLMFLSGNEMYWNVRWENSMDADGTPYTTMVAYKEIWSGANTDPDGETSTFMDPQYGPGQPSNALTGTVFSVDSYRLDTIQIPYDLSQLRFWSDTAVAGLQPGQTYSLTPGYLGYEWDSDVDNGFRPDGLIDLSSTTLDVNSALLDYGTTTGDGSVTHNLTLYRAPSGALVFGAGTVYWSWGLDDHHDNEQVPTDPNVQQAMVNLFADMGVQPETLVSSLVLAQQSTDSTAPVTAITSPLSSEALQAGVPVTISGTAVDGGGGVVAMVEVSTDGGQSWHRATGRENWTYQWTPISAGAVTVLTRATDDSVNTEVPGTGVSVMVAPAGLVSLFNTSDTPAVTTDSDPGFVNLGMQFTSSENGTIVGIRYYKGLGDGGTHVGSLWTSTGTLLGSVTFTQESASGWQTATLATPISVTAGTTYMVSYNSHGHYADTGNYFGSAVSNGPLTALNGFFTYDNATAFPGQASPSGANYWVDVVFAPGEDVDHPPVAADDGGYFVTMNQPATFTASELLANDSDPDGDPLTLTGVSNATGGTVSFNAAAQLVTFTPTAGYTGPAGFRYTISDGRDGTASAGVDLSVLPEADSLFSRSDTPATLSDQDGSQVNLGVRFTTSQAGTIDGISYYKSAADTGTHTASLWTSTGTLLTTATFTDESLSGWQTAVFDAPVTVSAGTTYVASFHSNGHYASTGNFFTGTYTSGPLSAPTGAGVYGYGSSNAMPTNSFGDANYWVDVLFSPAQAGNQPPTAHDDGGLAAFANTPLTIAAATLLANDTDPNGDTLALTGVSNPLHGTASFDGTSGAVTFTPASGYTGTAGFTYSISDGKGGTASANVSLSVTEPYETLFSATSTPATANVQDASPVELGMKFTPTASGQITAIRFYKGTQNTGTHSGSLWTSAGSLLESVTFTGETASGWQTATLATPINVTAGTTYVVSYHTSGFYSANSNYFASAVTNGDLTAPASGTSGGNGLYAYGTSSQFPTQSYSGSNYWVDVAFVPSSQQQEVAPVAHDDSGYTTGTNTALQIAATSLLANDTDANGDPLTVTGVSAPQNGTVSYDAQTAKVTFTPTAGYTGTAGFTYSISDGRGGTASAKAAIQVQQPSSTQSLFAANATPATLSDADGNSVELGMKFSASANGEIDGIRFYKGAGDTGTHTGTLWTATGTQLGSVTFTNETASGWQSANFNAPIAITAGTTYVVSYHSSGHYASTGAFFTDPVTNGALTAPASSASNGNGVYAYGSGSLFPSSSFNASNYWVDVLYSGQLAA